jgi:hypothetical protein
VYEAALSQARKSTIGLVTSRLTVDPESLPQSYELWFSFPWYRIYTVNIDSLATAAERAFNLPRELDVISGLATSSPPPADSTALQVIHLNGTLSDLPDVTFSMRQYAQRLSSPDLWYENLVREMQLHPVLFVGTDLNEPSLWTYVEARGRKAQREVRPASYLVTPHLARARAVALSRYNITRIDSDTMQFAEQVLSPLASDALEGRQAISARVAETSEQRILLPLLDVMDDSVDDEREFLEGREPRWSDITHGYAFERQCDRRLSTQVEDEAPQLVLLTGTAGVGKTTTAMRYCLDAAASGKSVYVLNALSYARFREIVGAVDAAKPDILFINDVERFGESASALLSDLLDTSRKLMVISSVRSSKLESIGEVAPAHVKTLELSVPRLEDSDVDELLSALDRANRLGALKGLTNVQRRQQVERRFGSQMLVALIEIVNDVRFDEKVESECRDLKGAAVRTYAAAALATSLRASLLDEELVIATRADTPAEGLEVIDRLIGRHLLIRTNKRRIAFRHSVIASRAVTYFRECGMLAPVVESVLWGLATTARLTDLRSTPSGRLLIRLINHDFLIRMLYRRHDPDVDKATVRSTYDSIESVLSGDYHYWLQRGSFETEDGDLNKARNFLEQARSMEPDDAYVRTEWSYMMLKRASRSPSDQSAPDDVQAAFNELDDVIAHRGKKDGYPFHIYGSQGLAWAHRGPLGPEGKKHLLERLRTVVRQGTELHPKAEDLAELKRDIEHEYLMLAVPDSKK